MIYMYYALIAIIFFIIINPKKVLLLYDKFKTSKNFIATLFASLGISALANKIDYLLYADIKMISKWWFSIVFGIISLLIGLWLYNEKE